MGHWKSHNARTTMMIEKFDYTEWQRKYKTGRNGTGVSFMLAEIMENGQIALPPALMNQLEWKSGDKLNAFVEEGQLCLHSATVNAHASKIKGKSARGIARKYANPELIPLEKGAFERAMAEKYENRN